VEGKVSLTSPPKFVSYAQNFEDVVLWRALRSQSNGFYIDIGASNPVKDSVTHAFYQRGWRGINVEPAPTVFRLLCDERPEDVNLQCLVGSVIGAVPFYLIGDESGFSTMDVDVARAHAGAGMAIREISVAVETLANICKQHVRGEVHFLKIDVEGAEALVLQGADLCRWRPWIIVIEAMFPNTTEPSHLLWEPPLLACGYHFIYFDGLNRFYVSNEKRVSLSSCFSRPPSPVLDWFVSATEENCVAQATRWENEAKELIERLAVADRPAQDAVGGVEALLQRVTSAEELAASVSRTRAALVSSTSWKVTAPMRALVRTWRQLKGLRMR
jgi:FkbM family methyltransferase